MEWLKAIGVAGFLFFLFKGLLWLLLFFLVARGIIKKDKVERFKSRLRIFKRQKNPIASKNSEQ